MTSKKPTKYSRPKICREFGITDRTLRHLERYGQITFSWEAYHGMLRTTLDDDQRLTLECGRLDVHSLTNRHESYRVLPFERFLLLRFFQVEADELYDELVDRNLIHRKYMGLEEIERHYGVFYDAIPDSLKECVRAKREPNKKEKVAFERLLAVNGILQVYQQPFVEQSFEMLSEDNVKMVIEAATATTSDITDICHFLSEATGVEFNSSAVIFYQWLFSDYSRMRAEDLKVYTKTLSPAHRGLISSALNKTVGDLRAALGMTGEIGYKDAYNIAMREVTKRLFQVMKSDTLESNRKFQDILRSFMNFVDREDRKVIDATSTTKLPDMFNAFEVIPSKVDTDIFKLPSPANDDDDVSAEA